MCPTAAWNVSGQSQAATQFNLPHGWHGFKHRGSHLLPPSICVSRKLELKQRCDSNLASDMDTDMGFTSSIFTYIPKSLGTLKALGIINRLKVFYEVLISIEPCKCLLPLFSYSKHRRSCNSQGGNEHLNNNKLQMHGQQLHSWHFV